MKCTQCWLFILGSSDALVHFCVFLWQENTSSRLIPTLQRFNYPGESRFAITIYFFFFNVQMDVVLFLTKWPPRPVRQLWPNQSPWDLAEVQFHSRTFDANQPAFFCLAAWPFVRQHSRLPQVLGWTGGSSTFTYHVQWGWEIRVAIM